MAKKGGEVKESPEEIALAEIARDHQDRFNQVWKPIRDKGIADIRDVEPERRRALGIANAESKMAFGRAKPIAERTQIQAGAMPGSGRFNSAMTNMAVNEGTSSGANQIDTNQYIDDSRVAGLMSLAQMGRGEQGAAIRGLSDAADLSSRQAEMDAFGSLQESRALQNVIGMGTGYGLSAYRTNQARANAPKI